MNLLAVFLLLFALGTQSRAAENSTLRTSTSTAKSSGEFSLHKAKHATNHALDELGDGIHKAAHSAKKGANNALQAVDDTVHGRHSSEK